MCVCVYVYMSMGGFVCEFEVTHTRTHTHTHTPRYIHLHKASNRPQVVGVVEFVAKLVPRAKLKFRRDEGALGDCVCVCGWVSMVECTYAYLSLDLSWPSYPPSDKHTHTHTHTHTHIPTAGPVKRDNDSAGVPPRKSNT